VTVFTTGVTRLFWEVFTLREMLWHKRDLSAKNAAIRYLAAGGAPPPDGKQSPTWSLRGDLALPTGPGRLLNITAKVGEQADWLCRENPDYLLTYPSNVVGLAHHFQANGLKLPRLREISTLGEIVTPEIRQLCRDVFGVKLVDIYSCRETGYLALQCPGHDHYHVQSENVLLEVLDAANRPCRPGEVGRVVVSTLQNYASPLFRYEVGDFAEVGDPCPCGRGLPVLRRILGRVRNMLSFPDGSRAWPTFNIAALEKVAPFSQFQIVQKTLEELEVRLVPLRPLTADEECALSQALAESLGHSFRCRFVYYEEIPRSAGGKYEDFRSEVTPSATIAERPNP
jgi:phenylacetate-CoA ligase